MSVEPIRWEEGAAVVLDQSLLPNEELWVRCETVPQIEHAICAMQVRGAPLIGVTAAFGMALGARDLAGDAQSFMSGMREVGERLSATRPTAVNLFWGIQRMLKGASGVASLGQASRFEQLVAMAEEIRAQDIAMCRSMGRHGQALFEDGDTVMTHCNAGALATAGYGSALGVVRAAVEAGKSIRVLARETRPLLQGARLTAWELHRDGIDVTVVPDSAGAHLLSKGAVDRIIVGADRIAANGDTANKIGTLDLAIIAQRYNVPFYVAAPFSTVDFSMADGTAIPIEERAAVEMTHVGDTRLTPTGVPALNPAFDVTPNELIAAIVTEEGISTSSHRDNLQRLLGGKHP